MPVLAEKPWRGEAVLRLALAIFLFQLFSSMLLTTTRYSSDSRLSPLTFGILIVASVVCYAVAFFLIRKPWEVDEFTKQFILLIFAIYMGLTLSAFASHFAGKADRLSLASRSIVAAITFQGLILALAPLFLRYHRETWSSGFGLKEKPVTALSIGVLVGTVFFPVGGVLRELASKLADLAHLEPHVQQAVQALNDSSDFRHRIALGITTLLIAPVAEELFFRGIMYPTIKRLGFPKLAFFGTSLFFAVIHGEITIIFPLFVFAMILTYLYEKTGNLLAPIGAHATFNFLNFLAFLIAERNTPPPG